MAYAMPGLHVLQFLYIRIAGHEAHFDKCIGPIQHRLLQKPAQCFTKRNALVTKLLHTTRDASAGILFGHGQAWDSAHG